MKSHLFKKWQSGKYSLRSNNQTNLAVRVQVLQIEQEHSRQDRSKNKDPSLKRTCHALRIEKRQICLKQMEQKKMNMKHEGKDTVINQIMKVLIGHGRLTLRTNSESPERSTWKYEAELPLNCLSKQTSTVCKGSQKYPNSQHYMCNVKYSIKK